MFTNMRAIYEVYRAGSFTKAANNLYVSQPALSAMVKKTEGKIGMPIFDRSSSPIQLTETGIKYIKNAEKIMDLEEEFSCYVGDVNGLKTGHLAVGCTYLFSVYIMPTLLMKYGQQFPHIKVSLHEGSTPHLAEQLFSGAIDILIDNYPMDEKIYDKKFLMKERLLLAVPSGFSCNKGMEIYQMKGDDIRNNMHYDSKVKGVPLHHFADENFVMMRSHNDTRERADEIFHNAGFTANASYKLNQISTVYHMSLNGVGPSIVSDTVVRFMKDKERLTYYKIDDLAAERDVYLYYKKNRYFTRSMEEFMKMAIEEVKN